MTADPACYILNAQINGFGHRFVYTPKMLRASLQKAGFRSIEEYAVSESDDAVLVDIEQRARWRAREANAYETMVFQATR